MEVTPAYSSLPSADKKNLLYSVLILPLTFASFYFLPQLIGKTAGYLASFTIYWSYCLVHGAQMKSGSMIKLYRWPGFTRQNILMGATCFIPVVGAFTASFSLAYKELNLGLYLILIVAALVNGFVEEFYWRGAFISRFQQNRTWAFMLPTTLFGLWHLSVYIAYGVEYQGGFFPLVGGAFFMGILWGYTAFRQQRILIPTLAHILTNFFAFSNLIVENWVR